MRRAPPGRALEYATRCPSHFRRRPRRLNVSFFSERSAGICLPLSALRSHEDWGVGEVGHLPRFARWMRSAGLSWLALLPLNECALGQDSPYSTLSAFALRSEEHTSELQSRENLVCRLLLE